MFHETPLAGAKPVMGKGVTIAPASPAAMLTLRADLARPAIGEALSAAFPGAAIPAVRRFTEAGGVRLVWMAPDELLIVLPPEAAKEAMAALHGKLAGGHALLADMSDARARFWITGENARGVLAQGAPVDFAPSQFGLAQVRRTRLQSVAVAIMQIGTSPERFELLCFRSVARYVWQWLAEASGNLA